MERQSRVHLDHPSIRGRVRTPQFPRGRTQHQTDLDGRTTPSASQPVTSPQATAPVPPAPVAHIATKPEAPKKQANLLKIRTNPMPASSRDAAHLPRQSRSGVLRRQMVKSASKKYRHKKKHSYKLFMITSAAMFVLLLGSVGGLLIYKKIHSDYVASAVLAKQTLAQKESDDDGTSSNDIPSEDTPPTNLSSYMVSNTLPRFLKIEKLGVNARVRHVGPDNDNGIKGPSNIYDVGWYENSSHPGENGTTLIDGHVAGQSKRGVFYGLSTLKKGDKMVIERGDGKHYSYTVVSIEQVDFDNFDMHKVMNSVVNGKPGLNLMTASGRYNVRTNQYEKRVIVYAVQD